MGDLTIIKNPHYNVAVRCYWPWRKTHSHYHQRLQVFFLKHNFIISAKIWINSIFTSVSYILSHVKSGFRNYSVALDCCVREMGIWIMLLPYGLVLTIYPIYSEIHLVYIKIQYSSDVSISHEKCHLVHKGILFTQVPMPIIHLSAWPFLIVYMVYLHLHWVVLNCGTVFPVHSHILWPLNSC